MALKKDTTAVGSMAALMATIFFVTVACTPTPPPASTSAPSPTSSPEIAAATPIPSTPTPSPTSSPESAAATATPANRWSELAQRTPYP